jgi:hypothetical protein
MGNRQKADQAGVLNTGSRIKVFKNADGEYIWIAYSSNAFRDRDREIVSLKALAEDCDRADLSGDYGPLRFWHIPGVDVGDCTFNMVYGPTLIEGGTFRYKEIGAALEERGGDYQISLGFNHPLSEPDDRGVFHTIRRYERSLVPRGRVANQLTDFVTLRKESAMSTLAEKIKALKALVDDPELAGAILEGAKNVQKDAAAAGLDFAEKAKKKPPVPPMADDEAEETEEETEVETEEESEEETEEEGEKDYGGPYLGDMNPDEYARIMATVFADALTPVLTRLKSIEEMGASQKEAANTSQAEQAKTIIGLEKKIGTLAKELKTLKGDMPPAAGGAYVPSEADDNLQEEDSRLKDAAPHGDPLGGFSEWVLQGHPAE